MRTLVCGVNIWRHIWHCQDVLSSQGICLFSRWYYYWLTRTLPVCFMIYEFVNRTKDFTLSFVVSLIKVLLPWRDWNCLPFERNSRCCCCFWRNGTQFFSTKNWTHKHWAVSFDSKFWMQISPGPLSSKARIVKAKVTRTLLVALSLACLEIADEFRCPRRQCRYTTFSFGIQNERYMS